MVCWGEKCIVRFRNTDYTADDIQNAWYSEAEINSFKDERKIIRQLVKSMGSIEAVEKTMGGALTCQGLEKYVSKSKTLKRKERIQRALHAVCVTQEDAFLARNFNPEEAIAAAYKQVTRECQKEANLRALLNLAKNAKEQDDESTAVLSPAKTPTANEPLPTNASRTKMQGSLQARFSGLILRQRE